MVLYRTKIIIEIIMEYLGTNTHYIHKYNKMISKENMNGSCHIQVPTYVGRTNLGFR